MHLKHLIHTLIYLLAVVLVFSAMLYGLNFITGPVIEKNNASDGHGHELSAFVEKPGLVNIGVTATGGEHLCL